MESDVELTCSVCGQPFKRLAKEHRRNMKRGRKVYCGNSCSAKDKPEVRANWNRADLVEQYLKPNWGRLWRDRLSPFRYYTSKANCTHRKNLYGVADLTAEYLADLWDKQGGICPYTGLKMVLPKTSCQHHIKATTPLIASLDRIDSTKGYLMGNVEFVCLAVNLAKNSFSKRQMLDFFSPFRDTQVVL